MFDTSDQQPPVSFRQMRSLIMPESSDLPVNELVAQLVKKLQAAGQLPAEEATRLVEAARLVSQQPLSVSPFAAARTLRADNCTQQC